jgi:hypothetical protein
LITFIKRNSLFEFVFRFKNLQDSSKNGPNFKGYNKNNDKKIRNYENSNEERLHTRRTEEHSKFPEKQKI